MRKLIKILSGDFGKDDTEILCYASDHHEVYIESSKSRKDYVVTCWFKGVIDGSLTKTMGTIAEANKLAADYAKRIEKIAKPKRKPSKKAVVVSSELDSCIQKSSGKIEQKLDSCIQKSSGKIEQKLDSCLQKSKNTKKNKKNISNNETELHGGVRHGAGRKPGQATKLMRVPVRYEKHIREFIKQLVRDECARELNLSEEQLDLLALPPKMQK